MLFENRVTYEITWKNIVQPDRPQKTIWRTSNGFAKAVTVYVYCLSCT